MKLAIVHHHFNRGGVTQVALNHVRALLEFHAASIDEILLVHGGRRDGWPRNPLGDVVREAVVPSLEYNDQGTFDPHLAQALLEALQANGFGPKDTLVHAHNHCVGKHASFPTALEFLAGEGYRLLLQVHDFSEDLRPTNYRLFRDAVAQRDQSSTPTVTDVSRAMYPDAPQIHYATLNQRDRAVLLSAGASPQRLHLLPNPVTGSTDASKPDAADAWRRFRAAHNIDANCNRMVLYPVRAIRRKNIGELLLWAALSMAGTNDTVFAVTLPATSDAETPSYQSWKAMAEDLRLKVIFDVGLSDQLSFEDNLAAASRIITTSVAEGFGLVFLECWLHNRALVGRNLPAITSDFVEAGIDLSMLGSSIEVPIHWFGLQAYLDQTLELARRLNTSYDRDISKNARRELYTTVENGWVDFAALPVAMQRQVVERVSQIPSASTAVRDRNPWILESLKDDNTAEPIVRRNKQATTAKFSLQETADRLQQIYQQVMASDIAPVAQGLPQAANILDAFLSAERLNPVRIESGSGFESIADSHRTTKERLVATIGELSQPLEPRPTSTPERLTQLPNIRAVIFDIYGTMLVSGAGDMTLQTGDSSTEALRAAFRDGRVPEEITATCTIDDLQDVIKRHHQRSREIGLTVPEVDIVAVWTDLLSQKLEVHPGDELETILDQCDIQRLAVSYECRVNPVWPMPDLRDCLSELYKRDLSLGIVSNAQSMTPLLFDALLNASVVELGFKPELVFYSYLHGESKPSSRMFDALVAELRWQGLAPENAVYIGNDMLNDVWSAQQAGLRTLLFAGDERSLRLRKDHHDAGATEPDGVIQRLTSIVECLQVD